MIHLVRRPGATLESLPEEVTMIDFQLSVTALGNTRFAYSPIGEVGSSLRLLGSPRRGYVMRPWLVDVAGQLSSAPMDLLEAVAPPGKFAARFLFAWSADPRATIEGQLEELASAPTESIRKDLQDCWRGRTMPPILTELLDRDPNPGAVIADAVFAYWKTAIAPYWSRIRAVLDDDIAYRANRAVTHGVLSVLDDLHPEVRLRDDVLSIDKPHHPDASYDGSEIILLPSVFVWPDLIIGHEGPSAFSLTYAARGVGRVWEGLPGGNGAAQGSLSSLLGRNRAGILRRLEIPRTTTQLARELGQSPGTVSQHLSVLKRSGLLESWRSGRSVLYRRTALAASIIAASEHREDLRAQQ
jgi:DNA-binding transcriptional ArsR family regulator